MTAKQVFSGVRWYLREVSGELRPRRAMMKQMAAIK